MKKANKISWLAVVAAIFVCLVQNSVLFLLGVSSGESPESYFARVERAVDGDTILLENGQRVRYIGIDCPETKHPRKPKEPFGDEAWEYNRKLVEGREVFLTFDIQLRDKYGRMLAYVFVDEIFVNALLVKEGYANVSTFPPNILYEQLFMKLESRAREQKRGLWKELR